MAGGRSSGSGGNDLNEVVRQLAVVAQQLASNSTGNGDAQGELFKKVAQSKPPTYQGEPDPVVLENWLREFEKLFGAMGCPKTQKMDKMTVTEYYTKFIELSRFAEGSVSTEKAKARKFESGLTTDLQLKLCREVFETLNEVYGRAAHLYALEEKKKKELAEIEGRENRKEVGQVSGNQQGNQNAFKKQKCKNNYPGLLVVCREGNAVTCRFCNKLGHREYECFSKNSNGNRKNNNNSGVNQRNFQQNNNNFAGNKGVQQNGARNINTTSGNNQQKIGTAGKLNFLSKHEVDATKDVITGTFSINSIPVKVLFDSGATFSFISKAVVAKLKDCLKTVEVVDLPITIPTGGIVNCTTTFRNVPLEIEGKIFSSELIEFGLSDFDLILGMDWLSNYNAEISCRSQKVKMVTSGNESVTYWMNGKTKYPRVISVLKLAKYMEKEHPVYFCSVKDMNHEQVTNPENIEVVNEFLDI
ncbi:uncharacterized protein LOC110733241 [Chenopodium quinoa]|uniref:uncharacterized protein LOC110733241 n=1 Tax=Chenopodium quinoa TaxID=63459 RepID=UPI000B79928E|nr:uncharacterized protein LOC110733241 [Chenopodium quinoa]